jgi:hypothetical protein
VCGAKTPPTATEAFNLRIRCKQMADEKADAVAWHEMTVARALLSGCLPLTLPVSTTRAAEWAREEKAAATRRAYRSDFRIFEA